MVNNSTTNINRANNYLFPEITEVQKKAMTHADGNSDTVIVHSQNVAELNQLMGSQSPS